MSKRLDQILGHLAGAASMCWQPRPSKEVFAPEEATEHVNEAQAAIAELVEECLPDIKVGTKNLPLNDLERGYNVAVEDIRNNLIKAGVLK